MNSYDFSYVNSYVTGIYMLHKFIYQSGVPKLRMQARYLAVDRHYANVR